MPTSVTPTVSASRNGIASPNSRAAVPREPNLLLANIRLMRLLRQIARAGAECLYTRSSAVVVELDIVFYGDNPADDLCASAHHRRAIVVEFERLARKVNNAFDVHREVVGEYLRHGGRPVARAEKGKPGIRTARGRRDVDAAAVAETDRVSAVDDERHAACPIQSEIVG